MILLAGEANFQDDIITILKEEGYFYERVLVDAHVQVMDYAASQSALLGWLTDRPAVTLTDLEARFKKVRFVLHEWQARIAHLNESTGGNWFIHDYRPLWWFDFFQENVGEVKIIPLRSDETDYHRAIGRFFKKRLPAGAMETKLNAPPRRAEIEAYLARPAKKIIHLKEGK